MREKVRSEKKEYTIDSLYGKYKKGRLVISPDFQRRFVWEKKKASKLVESILLSIPIPLIFTAEVEGGCVEVIDGQQRLTSIFRFIDGRWDGQAFRLIADLDVLGKEVGGKTFKELSDEFQEEILNYTLTTVCIMKDTSGDIKYKMFERLNTNITKLIDQEIRNCVYRGPYNEFLKGLATDKDFRFVINSPRKANRMLDVELVLMFFAFYHTPYWNFNSLKSFCDKEMKTNQNISVENQEKLRAVFKNCVDVVKYIWGDKAVRQHGKSGIFNQGLYQAIMYWMAQYKKEQIIPFSRQIKEKMIDIQKNNIQFKDALNFGANSKSNVVKKFEIWGNALRDILGYAPGQPRNFSRSIKEDLWEKSNVCAICGQEISCIEDAEVDHVESYSSGGRTTLDNAQLAHMVCNRKKGAKAKGFNLVDEYRKIITQDNNLGLAQDLINYRNKNMDPEFQESSGSILSERVVLELVKCKPTSPKEFYSKMPPDVLKEIKITPDFELYIKNITEIIMHHVHA